MICGNSPTCNGRLSLANTGVHGAVAALRALPGLGEGWGSISYQFSACSTFRGCDAAGLALISVSHPLLRGLFPFCKTACLWGTQGAADVAGRDECACCAGSAQGGWVRERVTGACIEG